MAELTISIHEAAKRSGIGISELYNQCKHNPSFPAFKVGKKIRVYINDFDKWVADLSKQRSGFKK